MIKTVLVIWVILVSACVILIGLGEIGKRIIKRLRRNKPPKKSRLEDNPSAGSGSDDDNSWRNNQHFDSH